MDARVGESWTLWVLLNNHLRLNKPCVALVFHGGTRVMARCCGHVKIQSLVCQNKFVIKVRLFWHVAAGDEDICEFG